MPMIREVMTPNVDWVTPEMSLMEVARHMRDHDIGIVPVAEDDRLVGMVTDRDIVTRIAAESPSLEGRKAREAMTSKVLYCFDDQDCEEIAQNMAQNQVRRLPVMDRDKRLVGIVSIGDLSHKAQPSTVGHALDRISQPTGAASSAAASSAA